jgi:hypothetical protein
VGKKTTPGGHDLVNRKKIVTRKQKLHEKEKVAEKEYLGNRRVCKESLARRSPRSLQPHS